ncbi:MAG: TolC family outer membrane protein, partial [Pseudomonadota bacterium]
MSKRSTETYNDGSKARVGRRAAGRKGLLSAGVALAALAAGTGPGAAQTSLADAMVRAYNSNPGLAADRAGLRALDEDEVQARSGRLGELTGQATYGLRSADGGRFRTGTSRDDTDPVSLGVGGSIPIYDGGQIENASEAAESGVLAGRQDLIATEQSVLLDAVTAFEDVRRDIGLVGVARSNVRVISEQLRAAQDRFEVGEVTRTDVSQAEARLAAARSQLAATTGSLAQSRQAYLLAVGELPDDLQPPPPLPQLPATEAAALALAEAQHPTLQSARFQARQAGFNVKRTIGQTLPRLDAEVDASYSNSDVFLNGGGGNGESNSVSLGLRGTIPLWTGGDNPSQVRESQARLAQAQAVVQDVGRQIRQAVSNSWSGLEVARISITAAREQIRAAQIAFDGVREEATLGARTTLDVLDADQELQNARADLIIALRDEYVAGYSLLSAVGSLTVDHLGLQVRPYDVDASRERVRRDRFSYDRDESTQW